MADPAPSEDTATPSSKAPAEADAAEGSGANFTNTNQHVADRQTEHEATERFTNTKLNIALINDPKRGPRFTLTKREAGLKDQDSDKAADRSKSSREQTTTEAAPPAGSVERAMPPPAPMPIKPDETALPDVQPARAEKPDVKASMVEATAPPPEALPGPLKAMEARVAPDSRPPVGPATIDEPPRKVPIDSSKTFVGHNGTYYDESWRWMDWRGTRRSWNWPAALSFGHWFAYRRLYAFAALHLLWLGGLAAASVNNVPILALIALAVLAVGLTGLYGNTLYFFAFRRAVDHVTEKGEGSYQELRGQLAAAGGTSVLGAGFMGVLSIASIAGALAATFYWRGDFSLNFWPF